MPSCTLEIGGRIVARAEGGPFDAEYALFEAHEIELRSNNEPGTVREHGYRTTAELALDRLEAEGVTPEAGENAATALGALAAAYARGPEVRKVISLLGAAELFEGHVWQTRSRQYEGAWLDVTALASDLARTGAWRLLQMLHLATLLSDAPPDSNVYLSTTEYSASRRPGERSHKRVTLPGADELPEALKRLADAWSSDRPLRESGPSRGDLLDWASARLEACARASSRIPLEALSRALSVRDRPLRGPLADPELWALELQLADGDPLDAQAKIDTLEKARGRQPGTAYLRGRAALLLGSEDARTIAERVSALAMSMSSFAELELLAAEAWAQAGEQKRALAYAHDLVGNTQVDPTLRARARRLVEPAPPSAPDTVRQDEPDAPPPSSSVTTTAARSETRPLAITATSRSSPTGPNSPAPPAGASKISSAPPPVSRPPGTTTTGRGQSAVSTATARSISSPANEVAAALGPPPPRSPSPAERAAEAIAPTPIVAVGGAPPRRGPRRRCEAGATSPRP